MTNTTSKEINLSSYQYLNTERQAMKVLLQQYMEMVMLYQYHRGGLHTNAAFSIHLFLFTFDSDLKPVFLHKEKKTP